MWKSGRLALIYFLISVNYPNRKLKIRLNRCEKNIMCGVVLKFQGGEYFKWNKGKANSLE